MDLSTIAVRYAKAFFATAKERTLLDVLKMDIETVLSVCETSDDFVFLLESPVVRDSQKAETIQSIFSGKVDSLTLNFLLLIIKNKREVFIPGICRKFLALCREDQKIKSVRITTAEEISDETADKLKKLIETELNATVELEKDVKAELIGGLVLRLEDKQFDASVASQLKKIKTKLLETELK